MKMALKNVAKNYKKNYKGEFIMLEYTTQKGTKLFYYVDYTKGGYNDFTDQQVKRGYYINVQRDVRKIRAFNDISEPFGACRMLLVEAGRRGKNKEAQANNKAPEALKNIVERFNI